MIKFISYDGKYPNLCSGVLTVDINGQLYAFCSITEHDQTHFRLFWKGRGCLKNIPNLTLGDILACADVIKMQRISQVTSSRVRMRLVTPSRAYPY